MKWIVDVVDDYLNNLESPKNTVSTGFKGLDNSFRGLEQGKVYSFINCSPVNNPALNIILNVSKTNQALVLTDEAGIVGYSKYILERDGNIKTHRLEKASCLNLSTLRKLMSDLLEQYYLCFDDTYSDVDSMIKGINDYCSTYDFAVVFISNLPYLQWVSNIDGVMEKLKKCAEENNVAIFITGGFGDGGFEDREHPTIIKDIYRYSDVVMEYSGNFGSYDLDVIKNTTRYSGTSISLKKGRNRHELSEDN